MKRTSISIGFLIVMFCTSVHALEAIELLEPNLGHKTTLMEALKERKSSRSFSNKPLSKQVLSNLLWAAFGVNREGGMRTAPSAHNWQEIDIYVAMKEGVYIYDAKDHKLIPHIEKDVRDVLGLQAFTSQAPLGLIFVADHAKMGAQGEDVATASIFGATDAAYISQNVYLYCAAEGLSTVVLGWIDIPKLSAELGLKINQKIQYTQPVGYPAN